MYMTGANKNTLSRLALVFLVIVATHEICGSVIAANMAVVTDSVYGVVKDESGNDLSVVPTVRAVNQAGTATKEVAAAAGRYVLYFAPAERGVWWIGVRSDEIVPDYLESNSLAVDNTSNPSIQRNLVCYSADTVVHVKVIENGALPANAYRLKVIQAANSIYATRVTGVGSNNLATIGISKLFASDWYVSFVGNDSLYPIPANFILQGGDSHMVPPGDTVTLNLVDAKAVRDTIHIDAGDPLPDWDSVWLGLCVPDSCTTGSIDVNGVFTVYSDTGDVGMSVYCPQYLATPAVRSFHVSSDTSGNLGFTLNHAHCRVHGTLNNLSLPILSPALITATTIDSVYTAIIPAEAMTGAYSLDLCDGDWIITPPTIPNQTAPPPVLLTITESPDTVRTLDFGYSILADADEEESANLPDAFELSQNYPNPFNLSTVIGFTLSRSSRIRIEIFNAIGQRVTTIADRFFAKGSYELGWNGADDRGRIVPSGVYFYTIRADDFAATRKMLLLK